MSILTLYSISGIPIKRWKFFFVKALNWCEPEIQ